MSLSGRLARRAIGMVRARPALDFFVRRQVSRFPGLARRLRAIVARSRRPQWQQPAALAVGDDGALSEAARLVLQDLRRGGAPPP